MFCPVHEDLEMILRPASPNIKAIYACQLNDCIHGHGLLCPYCNESHGYPFSAPCKAEWDDVSNFIQQAILPGVYPMFHSQEITAMPIDEDMLVETNQTQPEAGRVF